MLCLYSLIYVTTAIIITYFFSNNQQKTIIEWCVLLWLLINNNNNEETSFKFAYIYLISIIYFCLQTKIGERNKNLLNSSFKFHLLKFIFNRCLYCGLRGRFFCGYLFTNNNLRHTRVLS